MTTKITRDVLESYLHCKHKGHLKLTGKQGTKCDYETLLTEMRAEVRLAAKALFEPFQLTEYLNTPRRLEALGHVASDESHQMFREALDESEKAREDARNLTLLEWAKELLLEEG
jgi:hypothetical protein